MEAFTTAPAECISLANAWLWTLIVMMMMSGYFWRLGLSLSILMYPPLWRRFSHCLLTPLLPPTAAKPRGGRHAAVLSGAEGEPADRGPRRRLRPVQDGGQPGAFHPVLLRRPERHRRQGGSPGQERSPGQQRSPCQERSLVPASGHGVTVRDTGVLVQGY